MKGRKGHLKCLGCGYGTRSEVDGRIRWPIYCAHCGQGFSETARKIADLWGPKMLVIDGRPPRNTVAARAAWWIAIASGWIAAGLVWFLFG